METKRTNDLRILARQLALFGITVLLLSSLSPSTAFAIKCIKPDGTPGAPAGTPPKCVPPDCEEGKLCNPIKRDTLNAFLLDIVGVVVQYGLILIVFFLVLAGFKFVVAQGNPEKISEAKKMLVWVIVGAFVLIGVYVIRAAVCGTMDKIRGVDPTKPSQIKPTCE